MGGGSVSGSHSTACSGPPLYTHGGAHGGAGGAHGGAHGAPPLLMPPGSGALPPLGATLHGLHAAAGLHGLPSDYGGLAQPIALGMARPLALAAAEGAWARLVGEGGGGAAEGGGGGAEGGGGAADGAAPGAAVLLRESSHVVGRSKSCRTVLAHSRVSAQHCVIYRGQEAAPSALTLTPTPTPTPTPTRARTRTRTRTRTRRRPCR